MVRATIAPAAIAPQLTRLCDGRQVSGVWFVYYAHLCTSQLV